MKLLAAFGLAMALVASPGMAQSEADTDAAIDNVLGDHTAYRAAFDAIQTAVADDDGAGLAEWVGYPIDVKLDGKELTIAGTAEFEEQYDSIVTDEIRAAIVDQQWQDLFANYQGVMFGDGQVWLNGICKDDKCAEFDVKIIAIQSTADNTPTSN